MKIFEEIEFWQYRVILKNFKEEKCLRWQNGRRKER
jgi:hypothetical protein